MAHILLLPLSASPSLYCGCGSKTSLPCFHCDQWGRDVLAFSDELWRLIHTQHVCQGMISEYGTMCNLLNTGTNLLLRWALLQIIFATCFVTLLYRLWIALALFDQFSSKWGWPHSWTCEHTECHISEVLFFFATHVKPPYVFELIYFPRLCLKIENEMNQYLFRLLNFFMYYFSRDMREKLSQFT